MGKKTSIEWTDATWNPVTGCRKVGPGCDHCYAERFAERWRGTPDHVFVQGFNLRLWPDRLEHPLAWSRPRLIFVCSMSDLFLKEIDAAFLDRIFEIMERADWHVFQILTKRSSRMRDYVRSRYGAAGAPLHIWLGVSVEDRARASRLQHLRDTPARVRFASFEPLLGPLGSDLDLTGIDWAIAGGESGPGARVADPAWISGLRDVCLAGGTAFFFKQWGGVRPKSLGRLLDGREWNEFPIHLLPKSFRDARFPAAPGGAPNRQQPPDRHRLP